MKKKIGKYLLVSELGQGQYGMVYKAIDETTSSIYAVKLISKILFKKTPQLLTLFATEMEVMSSIDHPNIVHLHEYLESNNNFYLVIDYCRDGDL